MPHPEDFADAHMRHWTDAERLFGDSRWANADHLYGFSAECGLKALLEAMTVQIKGNYRTHIHRLWGEFQTFSHGRTGARFLSMLPVNVPFFDWSPDNRYAHQSHFTRPSVERYRNATHAIRQMINTARQDGQLR